MPEPVGTHGRCCSRRLRLLPLFCFRQRDVVHQRRHTRRDPSILAVAAVTRREERGLLGLATPVEDNPRPSRYIGSDRLDRWDRDGTMQKPTIAIIGPGRAGSALGRALHQAGYTIAAIGGRTPDNVRNLADELGARACQSPATTIDLADLTIVAVPDDVILPLATDMVDSLCSAAGKAAVHLSGAQDRSALRPLAQQGNVRTGVFHHLQTFRRGPEAGQNVAGTHV